MRLGPATLLCLLTAAATTPAVAQPQNASLDLVRLRTTATVQALARGDARCTPPLPDGVRACLDDQPNRSRSYAIRVVAPNRTVGEIVSDYYRTSVVPAFDLARFYDAGAVRYALVVREREEDADLSRWKVYVFEADGNAAPLRFATAEHTGAASFPVVNGRRMLRVAAWEDDSDTRRLAGRVYRYDGGALVADAAAPVASRPWTEGHAAERRAATGADPAAWDWATAAVRTAHDPRVTALRVRTSTPGRLGDVSEREDGHLQVVFLPDDGSASSLVPVFDLADGATQRLLPDAYTPRGGWAAYLSGRRARLVAYRYPPSWTDANAIVWIER
ncbi:MAG: hypothetical protein LCH53_06950 [Bacteroidetes bacterium]|nr:hypothetical protein [Bacteroidota bacterium]